MKRLFAIAALASTAFGGAAIAQDEAERLSKDLVLDLTMTLIPMDAESSSVVTTKIALPKDARVDYIPSAAGVERSADGLRSADAAREDGRAFGAATAAAARENRENAGRTSREAQIEDRPAPPALPDRPTPPTR